MPSDPFVILGVARGASQSEILDAYKKKRAYYQQHVFDEGEAGADAARMLEVLDNAYQGQSRRFRARFRAGADPPRRHVLPRRGVALLSSHHLL